MEKDYTLKDWNTLAECYEEVIVSKELYDEYNRSHWKIKWNNKKFLTMKFSSVPWKMKTTNREREAMRLLI